MAKVSDICNIANAKLICGDPERDFSGVYVGDLLSRAMSRVEENNVWITIMANANVVAVATLTEPAAVILAEGVVIADDALGGAIKNGITVLSSSYTAYELCLMLNELSQGK